MRGLRSRRVHPTEKSRLVTMTPPNLFSVTALLDKTDSHAAEFPGLLQVHEVSHVLDHHAPRPRYSCLDCSRVSMNIGNIGVPYEQQRGYPDLRQSRQRRLDRELKVRVR